ncbi:MAG TPA: DUF488 family protein [Candidatus Dorea intestinavium]|nr:DUF488 family protein [Candidatus Dorea intestinavium]
MPLQIKRIYDEPQDSDGVRILIDRLWPRGVSKEKARLDEWGKNLAPSADLRKWFGHKKENFATFKQKYLEELDTVPETKEAIKKVLAESQKSMVTLLYGAKDPKINHAIVLLEYLEEKELS